MSNCITTPFTECSSYPNSRCVIYTGPNLNNIDTFTNDRLENILKKINAAFSNVSTSITLIGDVTGSGTNTINTTVIWNNGLTTYNTYYTPLTRQLTINGTTYDLSQNRTWTIPTYTLTPATSSVLGGVIIGSGITVQPDGTISVSTAYQAPITLTTLNNSGSATFISNVLNVPTYTLSGLGGQPLSTNLTSLSGLTYSSLGFVKMSASGMFSLDTNTYITSVGTGVIDEITYWSGTNTLGSLSTSTYPSLTELSYVKGVTSSIQTQLNTKGSGTVTSVAALTLGTSGTDLTSTVANNTTTPVITLNVPNASTTARGVVTTGTQTFTGTKIFNNTITASSNIARGVNITGTYTNATTSDVLVALDIQPTFTNTFTRYKNLGLRVGTSYNSYDTFANALNLLAEINGNTGVSGTLNVGGDSSIINLWSSGAIANGMRIGANYSSPGFQHLFLGVGGGNKQLIIVKSNGNVIIQNGGTFVDSGDKLQIDGNLNLKTAGNKIKIATGTNASVGTATLVNGTITISTTAVTASSLIMISRNRTNASTKVGDLCTSTLAGATTITAGTSFVINSIQHSSPNLLETGDQSTVFWQIIN